MRTEQFPNPFDHLITYNLVKNQPKWRLHNEEIDALAKKKKEIARDTIREKIQR